LQSDAINFALDGERVEAGDRQREEETNSTVKRGEGIAERAFNLLGRAAEVSGIGDAPMRGNGLAGPDGAGFVGGVVANGENKIHFRRIGRCEFIPTFAAETLGGQASDFELAQGPGMNTSNGVAAGAIRREGGRAAFVEDGFGHDRAGGISGAEEEDVIAGRHGVCPLGCLHDHMRLSTYV